MKMCDYCKKMSEDTVQFRATKTGKMLNICEDCLDGSLHDYFHSLIMKSKLVEEVRT